MMSEDGVNAGKGVTLDVGAEVVRRREEIFRAMVVVADRRRRGRRVKQVAAAAVFAAAAVAVVFGVLGTLPPPVPLSPGAPTSTGGMATAGGASNGSVPPAPSRPAQIDRNVTVRVVEPPSLPGPVTATVRGVERLDESKLRRLVVAEALTDEAFAQELAMQAEVGTARVRGRVLVLNNNPVAEGPRSVH